MSVDKEYIQSLGNFHFGKQTIGEPVVNALTGAEYDNITYGSKGEYLLWCVKVAGDFGVDKYYFDSPEQYEMANLVRKEHIITIPTDLKAKWRERRTKIMQQM